VETEAELKAVRHSLSRGTPLGDPKWQKSTAGQLGLQSLTPTTRTTKNQIKYNVPFLLPSYNRVGIALRVPQKTRPDGQAVIRVLHENLCTGA